MCRAYFLFFRTACLSTLAGGTTVSGWTDGTGTNAYFDAPDGLTMDSLGNIYVSDYSGHILRLVSTAGSVSTLAGSYNLNGLVDGTGSNARFSYIQGLAVDKLLNVYVADGANTAVRKVTVMGAVSTLFQQNNLGFQGLAFSPIMGLFAAEFYTHAVSIIATSGASMRTVFAGTGSSGYADGTGTFAAFNSPIGMVFSASGDLFVGEYSNRCIRKITSNG
jgi:hypothetical protein